ncbi:pupal cuticle protein 20-like [Daphnia carinata]|uniref:pupal cuticle protein 20-like n=1 Tax=Daphnia carinata TaxID=120202 RepID=UPI0025806620|nr:pupal cuticle protein 20-like [Daphnia carinata]
MKLFVIAAVLAVAVAAPSGYKGPAITITAQSDVRNADGSSQWSYAGSDGTTREESQAQLPGGKDYDNGGGNTNKGASYYISPEGQKISLTWTADQNGFLPKGDHLPVAPALPYSRSGLGI